MITLDSKAHSGSVSLRGGHRWPVSDPGRSGVQQPTKALPSQTVMATTEAAALGYQYVSQPSVSDSGGPGETPGGSPCAGGGDADVASPGLLSGATRRGRVDRERCRGRQGAKAAATETASICLKCALATSGGICGRGRR